METQVTTRNNFGKTAKLYPHNGKPKMIIIYASYMGYKIVFHGSSSTAIFVNRLGNLDENTDNAIEYLLEQGIVEGPYDIIK